MMLPLPTLLFARKILILFCNWVQRRFETGYFGTFVINGPTLGWAAWWKFVYHSIWCTHVCRARCILHTCREPHYIGELTASPSRCQKLVSPFVTTSFLLLSRQNEPAYESPKRLHIYRCRWHCRPKEPQWEEWQCSFNGTGVSFAVSLFSEKMSPYFQKSPAHCIYLQNASAVAKNVTPNKKKDNSQ